MESSMSNVSCRQRERELLFFSLLPVKEEGKAVASFLRKGDVYARQSVIGKK